ncbi:MAG: hypothetical protein Q8L48_14720 [Archangium sp.]|nr:hypothetical protein [Archangium sp.]
MAVDPSVLSRNVRGRMKFNCRVDALPSASEVESDGARLLVASTDDLLGLGCDARVREAAQTALRKLGLSRSEGTRTQADFEARAMSLFGADAALVISHEEALLPLLPTWRMATEARGRRSIPEAAQITSPEDAEVALSHPGMLGLILEAVHPLEGDLALTPRFAEACQRRHSNLLVIDDGLGVLGPTGGGAIEHLSLQAQVTMRVLPLGGAIPGAGALVLGDRELLDSVRGALPAPAPMSLAASARALDIAVTETARRARLFDVAQKMLTSLKGRGFDTGPCVTPWIPVWLGDEALCEQWLAALAELGIACRGWLAGPRSRLLLAMPATLTDAQVAQIAEAFERLSRKLQVPEPGSINKDAPVLARPGSYAMGAPAALHWTTVDPRERRPLEPELPHTTPPSSAENLTLRELVYDAVETMTWRATSVGSAQLRRSAEALRTLIDKRRR